LSNSRFGILFEGNVLRIYLVTCYVGLLTGGPDHSSNRNFWQNILAAWQRERAMVHLYGNHTSNERE
jgi:hypothetical protein